ncbi:glycosyltransferase family 2 protein [Agromyces humatus]|uniref:Glycosyltransferase 2-like domain-containing protein n=1 Tax=Agromyces humatus TaxID=279573 RepID=A0ABN2K6P8_9MICO|nr:glycosyltransferase [Agromyces humatus]
MTPGVSAPEPIVDVVVPIHDPTRRLDRAVASLLHGDEPIRVTVVCHGIAATTIDSQLPDDRARVRVVEFADGIASPQGPFNHGIDLATAPFVMIMGSDDYLEPGAVAAWLEHVEAGGADIVLAPLRHQSGELLLNPLSRPRRRTRLDPVRDRMFYRSAPLGLIRRDVLDERGLRFTEGAQTGGDQAVSLALWTGGLRIDFDRRAPAYVIGSDARTRVTTTPRSMRVLAGPVFELLASERARAQPARVRRSLATKLLRINVLGSIVPRTGVDAWSADDIAATREAISSIVGFAPGGLDDLCRADRALIDEISRPDVDTERIVAAIARHRSAGRFARTFPRTLSRSLSRESVLRRYANYAVVRWRP